MITLYFFGAIVVISIIGIIATLALVVIVALDPGKRFEDAKNSRRLSDSNPRPTSKESGAPL